MNGSIKRVVIIGGGSAGWLTAGLLASELAASEDSPVEVALIESPDVQTIGVGEGTWPTMRVSLQKIGISETDFLSRCTASFKQGTKFSGWVNGSSDDHYYHPFSVPAGYGDLDLAEYWQEHRDRVTFANAVGVQGYLCDRDLAPRQPATPDYAFVANYGYHLDAGKFAELLKEHCTQNLGVRYLGDHVTGVNSGPNGDIESVSTKRNGDISGYLFIDCTGLQSLLLGKHYGIPFISRSNVLFNDSALAIQVPYARPDSPIASQTISTARPAGWIWDIGLQARRGIGYTYSSAHTTEEDARRVLRDYLEAIAGKGSVAFEPRKISFESGHRECFWHRNCVAIGMSAGFLEPLEASALVMIELAGQMIAEEFPANRKLMDIVARRYNDKFRYRWDRIIDFLKLHYILGQRDDSAFWRDNRDPSGIPDGLAEMLELWRYQVPGQNDFPHFDEIFSAASYQYVLYGMGFETHVRQGSQHARQAEEAERLFIENTENANRIIGKLPTNRELLQAITQTAGATR
ncbi:MAG: tryptophan 7-halogenase [Gammaproteobacteria bacterium]|nr:tryptophan 7-halogenase [Gammaproteobacteria bacterium]